MQMLDDQIEALQTLFGLLIRDSGRVVFDHCFTISGHDLASRGSEAAEVTFRSVLLHEKKANVLRKADQGESKREKSQRRRQEQL